MGDPDGIAVTTHIKKSEPSNSLGIERQVAMTRRRLKIRVLWESIERR
jgi:hypothetical protein